MLNNKIWWKAAFVRALKTVAQTAVATIGTAALIERVNWMAVLSASALAGVLSMLTSLAGLPEVREAQASGEDKGRITVLAYDDYYDDGSPKSKNGVTYPETVDEPCEECNLTKYVEGGMNDD